MDVSIVIPAYNEEKRIAPTLAGVAAFLKGRKKSFEMVVVCDGKDSTPHVVREFARKNSLRNSVRVLEFKTRLGKGGALQKGFAAAKGRAVVMLDADYSVPAFEISKLLDALEENDVAIGSRYMRESKRQIPFVRLVFARVFNFIERVLFSLPYRDTQCGFKAFRASALKKLLPKIKTVNFVWDVDMLYRARKLHLHVKEIPVEWKMMDGGTITYSNGLKTAAKMFATLLKLRLSN